MNHIQEYISKYQNEFAQCLELVKKYDRIVIFRHRVPDFDALGTQLGLKYFLQEHFPDKEILTVGDDHNKFTPKLFEEMDIVDDDWFNDTFLAIICDVSDPDRVADERVTKATESIIFDHHPTKEQRGTIQIVDHSLAAASELVCAFCLSTGLKLNEASARNFYIALVGDSGRFMYSSVSPLTFSIAQELLAAGINITEIYNNMYENSIEDLRIQAYILTHYELSKNGVAYYILKDNVMRKLNLNQMNAKAFVNTFANIKGINVWCSISEDVKDDCWRVSIRSKKVDISGVAHKWQGGGHAQASGARINHIKDLKKFIADLDAVIEENL